MVELKEAHKKVMDGMTIIKHNSIPYHTILARNAVIATHPEKTLLLQYDALVSGKLITGRLLFYVAMVWYV